MPITLSIRLPLSLRAHAIISVIVLPLNYFRDLHFGKINVAIFLYYEKKNDSLSNLVIGWRRTIKTKVSMYILFRIYVKSDFKSKKIINKKSYQTWHYNQFDSNTKKVDNMTYQQTEWNMVYSKKRQLLNKLNRS